MTLIEARSVCQADLFGGPSFLPTPLGKRCDGESISYKIVFMIIHNMDLARKKWSKRFEIRVVIRYLFIKIKLTKIFNPIILLFVIGTTATG